MSPYGGGSSFSKKDKFKTNAQKMNVTSRWKKYIKDKSYWKLFKEDKYAMYACEKLFPDMYSSVKEYLK